MNGKRLRILLIDGDDGRSELAASLRNEARCECDECEEIVPLQAARDALSGFNQAANRSRQPISNEWLSACMSPVDYDIVCLHTSDDYSRDYFERFLVPKVTLLFSGDLNSSWVSDTIPGWNPEKHGPFERTQLQEHICDFVFEFAPNIPPPWDVFEGRSALAQLRERLFAVLLAISTTAPTDSRADFTRDLSGEPFLNTVLRRVSRDRTVHEKVKGLLARHLVRCWLKRGCETAENGSNTETDNQTKQEIEQLLKLLCKSIE